MVAFANLMSVPALLPNNSNTPNNLTVFRNIESNFKKNKELPKEAREALLATVIDQVETTELKDYSTLLKNTLLNTIPDLAIMGQIGSIDLIRAVDINSIGFVNKALQLHLRHERISRLYGLEHRLLQEGVSPQKISLIARLQQGKGFIQDGPLRLEFDDESYVDEYNLHLLPGKRNKQASDIANLVVESFNGQPASALDFVVSNVIDNVVSSEYKKEAATLQSYFEDHIE